MTAIIRHGDARHLPLPDDSVDAIVCDPPYSLPGGFMGRDWDRHDSPQAFGAWCLTWAAEALRVLKPGGHLLAFGGTKTWHRLTCAVEDAGFEIRESIAWINSQGYPKSLDVAKAIDRAGGASPVEQARILRTARERVGLSREQVAAAVGCTPSSVRDWEDGRARTTAGPVEHVIPSPQYRATLAAILGYSADERAVVGVATDRRSDRSVIGLGHSGKVYGEPATVEARRWDGWQTALRPAFEPIVVGRKPLAGTVAANVLMYGTGAINVDGCRTGTGGQLRHSAPRGLGYKGEIDRHGASGTDRLQSDKGRWPANVVITHAATPEGVDLCADGCVPGCPVDELDRQTVHLGTGGALSSREPSTQFSGPVYGNSGHRGCWTPYGDSGGASRFYPVFRYESKAPDSERPAVDGVEHETVKPLALMRWLVRLVTQPGGRVVDLFAGSGTTLEAAVLEAFDVIGIEREATYLPLIRTRVERAHRRLQPGVAALAGIKPRPEFDGQGDLLAMLTEVDA